MFYSPGLRKPEPEISYSRFKKELGGENLKKVVFKGEVLRGDFQTPIVLEKDDSDWVTEATKEATSFRTTLPPLDDPNLIAAHSSDADTYATYQNLINKVHEDFSSLHQTSGYPGIIKRYQAILDAFPNYDRNLELEVEIARLKGRYERPEQEEEAERKEFQHYLYIIDKYLDCEPEIRLVKRDAAMRIADHDRAESDRRFRELVEEYPTDDPLRLESYYYLGNNALIDGRTEEAEDCFAVAFSYDAGGLPLSDDERERVGNARYNSAAGILAILKSGEGPPELRLQQFEEGLKKYPTLTAWRFLSESAARFRQQLKSEIQSEVEDFQKAILDEVISDAGLPVDSTAPPEIMHVEEARKTEAESPAAEDVTLDGPRSQEGIVWTIAIVGFFVVISVCLVRFRRNSRLRKRL